MNLITEYQKRHKTDSIPVCHDGVCFFDYDKSPSLIALTSLSCRSFSTCVHCDAVTPSIIVEFFSPGAAGTFLFAGHHHVDPCAELNDVMNKNGMRGFVPYYAKDMRDLEIWLWRFCSQNSRMRGLKSVETDPKLKMVEQMVHAAQKHTKLYNAYFIAHEAFLPSRKYLLFQ